MIFVQKIKKNTKHFRPGQLLCWNKDNTKNKTLTHGKLRCKAAAGDSQVVCVPHTAQQVHACIPKLQVSVSAAGYKHLTARGEAAGHHTGLTDLAAAVDDSVTVLTISTYKYT